MPNYYSMLVDLRSRRCVIIGGGKVAERKVRGLLDSGADEVIVIAPTASQGLTDLEAKGSIRLLRREYQEEDLKGAFLVFAATDRREINEAVSRDGTRLGLLVNVVDRAEEGGFITPSVVRRGDLLLSVTTGGASPSLTARIRQELAEQYGDDYRVRVEILRMLREKVLSTAADHASKQELLRYAAQEITALNLDIENFSNHEYVNQWMMRLETGGNNMAYKVEGRRIIVVGTRQSALALTQTGQVIDQLKALCAIHNLPYEFEIRKIVTKGDRILDVTLSKVGGKGLFVKEIEQALFDEEIDLAVHSMKDMPYELPEGLVNGAVPKRVDPRDCLIAKDGLSLDQLPQGAKVGTSSLRRSSQLKNARPDLQIESIRGNIDSRIGKLETEGFDAIVLAAAGLHRMGWEEKISSYVPVEVSVPAVGQGALGIECRADDQEIRDLLALYTDSMTLLAVRAERSFLGELNGGCQIPIGAYATIIEQQEGESPMLELTGIVGSPDGAVLLKETLRGRDPEALGKEIADALRARGADRILAEVRG